MQNAKDTSAPKNREIIYINQGDMTDWWGGTVFLTLFPTIIAILTNFLWYQSLNIERIIGDGELILSAFLLITPSIIHYYKAIHNSKVYFYVLLFMTFMFLAAYVTIKLNQNNNVYIVYGTSIICIVTSIIFSHKSEKKLIQGEQQNE